ncbi:SWIM zinc finger family protein [Nonomuraea sp. NPDC000554]|uniref:SWIM zinc finger family protein n=1 Tax=Nonomuraea sp. NPDC000554 TaxID=3154259 RepID=UPI00331B96AF
MIERWSRDQVLALAPDASSQKAAQGVAAPGTWSLRGVTDSVLFGECRGSGAKPYQASVDLTEPAYRCSCPSRKFPCKHALGLLLLWSADGVPVTDVVPPWVSEWLAQRADRAAKASAKIEAARARAEAAHTPGEGAGSAGEGAASAGRGAGSGEAGVGPAGAGSVREGASGGADGGRAESVRERRVAAGLGELERWLADQVRQGLAAAGDSDWDELAKRLVDAQAPGVAGMVARLSHVRRQDDWPERLLEEYALINLLAMAYRRRAELPPELAQTVMTRTGFPVTREEVLASPAVRDEWHVLGRRDEEQGRLTSRKVWLRGRKTGRAALVLSFAPQGQPLDASLVTGTTVDADLAFYPGAAPLRALVAARHSQPVRGGRPSGVSPEEALDEVATALSEDPWTDSWPLVLREVVPGGAELGGLPLHPAGRDLWRLIAVSGGHPVTVAAEWTPSGLRPLTTWDDEETAVIL